MPLTGRFVHLSGVNNFNKDGHLITEDSVFPTTAPGGAPKRNRCYQDARYFITSPPCARFARALGAPRTAHYATPPLGAGAFVFDWDEWNSFGWVLEERSPGS